MREFIITFSPLIISFLIINIFNDLKKWLNILLSFLFSIFVSFTFLLFHQNIYVILSGNIIYCLIIFIISKRIDVVNFIFNYTILLITFSILYLVLLCSTTYLNNRYLYYVILLSIIAILLCLIKFNISLNTLKFVLSKLNIREKFKIYSYIGYVVIYASISICFSVFIYFKSYLLQNYILEIVLYVIILLFIVLFIYAILLFEKLNNILYMKLDSNYKKEIEDYLKVIRAQRHDFNFHLQVIYGLSINKNYNECHKYISNLVQDTQQVSNILPIKDPAVAAMIMSFKHKCDYNNITFNTDITYNLSNIAINNYELNRIIANVLQNAIDETSTHNKNKIINLYILKRIGMGIIRIENPIHETRLNSEEMFKIGITSKDKKLHSGIGLSTVKHLLNKCGGKIKLDIDNNLFITSIYLPLK